MALYPKIFSRNTVEDPIPHPIPEDYYPLDSWEVQMAIDHQGDGVLSSSSTAAESSDETLHPYHQPTLVYFGRLDELVKATTGVGSDGGAPADCTHL